MRVSVVPLGLVLLLSLPPAPAIGDPETTWRADECPEELLGPWRGRLDVAALLAVRFTVTGHADGSFAAEIRSQAADERVSAWRDGERIRFQSKALPIAFDGLLSPDGETLGGFVQHASTIAHIQLGRPDALDEMTGDSSAAEGWSTTWNPLGVDIQTATFDLYIERDGENATAGYFFFRDQRLPALWGFGFECREDGIRVRERNLGLRFEGGFDAELDALQLTATGLGGSATIVFHRMPQEEVPELPDAPDLPPRRPADVAYEERAPEATGDDWPVAKPSEEGLDPVRVGEMVRAIVDQEMTLTHSVLVARRGRLVVEEYFYGFDRSTWHDMRSASKTVTSALVGLAIDERHIEGVNSPALGFFPRNRRYANWDSRKARITVRDLLRMASGLDANDSDRRSVASEGAYQGQSQQPDWIKFALDAPMIADPGAQSLYGGANPLILGGILESALTEPVEWFAQRALFGPLGIHHYKFLVDPTGIVYMGGGLYLRPRDMAKFGQLYLDGGLWRGDRVISQEWVRESTGKYGRLAPLDRNGHQYGYLWWHHVYPIGDRVIETMEARGAGGQYIFVVPALELVVVVTSGNFRNGRYRQPEEILARFILPAVIPSPEAR